MMGGGIASVKYYQQSQQLAGQTDGILDPADSISLHNTSFAA